MPYRFRITTQQFIAALGRAAADDQRWPRLCSHKWLIDRATVRDGEVILDIKDDYAPRPAMDRLRG